METKNQTTIFLLLLFYFKKSKKDLNGFAISFSWITAMHARQFSLLANYVQKPNKK